MTIAEMKAKIALCGCTVRVQDGEIRVCPKGKSEDQAYYTNDRQDAVSTAALMGGQDC